MEILTKLSPIFRLVLFLLTLPVFGLAQQFPVNNQKIVQGVGTTAQGITSYSSLPPTVNPATTTWRPVTSMHVVTVERVQYIYKRPRWYAVSFLVQSNPPPATESSGSTTVDYTETIWQNTTDSTSYYYEEKQQCWQPVCTVVRDTTPVSLAATGTSAAVCYEYSLGYNSTNDSLYAYTAGDWLAIGSGGGGGGTFNSFNIAGDTGSDIVTDGQTVTVAGGYGINTAETGETVTVTADTTQLATQRDISGLTPITASNGLTKTGNDIALGGTTGNTAISGASTYDLDFTALDSLSIAFAKRFLITQNSQRFLHQTGGGSEGGVFENLFFGYQAGFSALGTGHGYANTVIGRRAGYNLTLVSAGGLTTASSNVFLGYGSGEGCTNCTGNTFVGTAAGSNSISTYANTYLGWPAGIGATGSYNTFLGRAAGNSSTASETVSVGISAGRVATGVGNTFVGSWAGETGTTARRNTYVGYTAGRFLSSGSEENTFVGFRAGSGAANVSAGYNTCIGSDSGLALTSGNTNTFLGRQAGSTGTTGSGNVFIGNNAQGSTTGSINILISPNAGAFPSATQSNSILIGPDIYATVTHTGLQMRRAVGNRTFRNPNATFHIRSHKKCERYYFLRIRFGIGLINF